MKENKKIKREKEENSNGITLIALVITIIVLLILASVSIAMLTGDNGILNQAQNAKNRTEEAEEVEKIKLAVSEAQIGEGGYNNLNQSDLQHAIDNQFGEGISVVADNLDGTFTVVIEDKVYEITNNEVKEKQADLYINSVEDFKSFRDEVNSGNTYEGKYIVLTSNITIDTNEEWEPIGDYPVENSSPDDETNKPFKGIFNGNGYEIDGIKIETTDKVQGLFGLVNNGKILNLTLGNSSSITGGTVTGGIVGYAYNGTIVNNCYNKGKVTGNNIHTGGVIGIAVDNCNITNSNNLGIINGQKNVGGIIGGIVNNTSVQNCSNTGKVTGDSEVGGIVGQTSADNCRISQNFNKGNVQATGDNIESGNSNVGGIVGLNLATISNCYNSGTIISASNNAGGLVGLNRGILENGYNVGSIDSSASAIGAIAGNNNEFFDPSANTTYAGKVNNCYSLQGILTSIIGVNNSIIGSECSYKSSDELKGLTNILGQSFKEDTNNINDGYPILNWQ